MHEVGELGGVPTVRSRADGWRLDNNEGATLVEMALSAMVILALLFGVIQVCFGLYCSQYTGDAAREGSRWAIVRGSQCSTNTVNLDHCGATQSDIQTYVRSLTYPGINISALTVTANWYTPSGPTNPTWSLCTTPPCNVPGNMVQVVVTYPFSMVIPNWQAATLNLSSSSSMVISQ